MNPAIGIAPRTKVKIQSNDPASLKRLTCKLIIAKKCPKKKRRIGNSKKLGIFSDNSPRIASKEKKTK